MPYLVREGVRLYYDEAGVGDAAMLFVHGWCCDRTHFAPQVKHFAPRFRTVSVDLRGHGLSDAPLQQYTIHGFADDLAWMCGRLGVVRPIVAGHSMGGLTTFILAAEWPELVRAAVLIDAPLLLSGDAMAMRRRILQSFLGDDGVNAAVAYANDRFFIDTDQPELRARVLETVAAMPQHVLASAYQSLLDTDSEAAARTLEASALPMLYIGTAKPLADLEKLRELCPQIMIGQAAGSGHFCQLEVPDQVNAMIERFLAVAL